MSDPVMDGLSAQSTQKRPIDRHPYEDTSEQGSWQALYDEHVKSNPTNVLGMPDLSRSFGGSASDRKFDERMGMINAVGPSGMRQYNAGRQQAARASTFPGPDVYSYVPYPTPVSGHLSMSEASQADDGLLEPFDWGSLLTTDALVDGVVASPNPAVRGPATNASTGFAGSTAIQEGSDRPSGDTFDVGGQDSVVSEELLDDYEKTFGTWVYLEPTVQADESGDAAKDQASGSPGSRDDTVVSGAEDTTMHSAHSSHAAAAEGL